MKGNERRWGCLWVDEAGCMAYHQGAIELSTCGETTERGERLEDGEGDGHRKKEGE